MKYIAFSFDDGRSDTYEVAMPIMQKYGIPATVNLISDGLLNPKNYSFASYPQCHCMTVEETLNWQRHGFEIASHGYSHRNSRDEVVKSIEQLRKIGVDVSNIGFASPESWLTEENADSSGIAGLLADGTVSYLRSGIQVRREGAIYTALALLEKMTHSQELYFYLNKKNIIREKHRIYPSAAVKRYTTLQQIQFMINHVKDGEALILMFHSIWDVSNSTGNIDDYSWDMELFEQLCSWLSENENTISVLKVKDLINRIEQ